MKSIRGFSLIELIMLITVLSLMSAVFMQMFSRIGGGLTQAHDLQIAQAMTQECYAYLRQLRRDFGYAMNGVNNCNSLTPFQSYGVASVALQSPYSGAACPSGANCKLFTISVPALAPGYENVTMVVE